MAVTGTGLVIELRRYRLRPGCRESLASLFLRELLEPQEALGMRVIGPFRDLDEPDHFVWIRAFPDMRSRAEALERFYGGPVWARHKPAANATMINSDNVLLLRPAGARAAPLFAATSPSAGDVRAPPAALVVSTTCHLAPRSEDEFAAFFAREARPLLERAGARVLAELVREPSPNSYPRLPVREGETVFVWLSAFDSPAEYAAHLRALGALESWTERVFPALDERVWRANEVSRLATSPPPCAPRSEHRSGP